MMRIRWIVMVAVMATGGCIAGCSQGTDVWTDQAPETPISVTVVCGPYSPTATQPADMGDVTNNRLDVWVDSGVNTASRASAEGTQEVTAEVKATVELLVELKTAIEVLNRTLATQPAG